MATSLSVISYFLFLWFLQLRSSPYSLRTAKGRSAFPSHPGPQRSGPHPMAPQPLPQQGRRGGGGFQLENQALRAFLTWKNVLEETNYFSPKRWESIFERIPAPGHVASQPEGGSLPATPGPGPGPPVRPPAAGQRAAGRPGGRAASIWRCRGQETTGPVGARLLSCRGVRHHGPGRDQPSVSGPRAAHHLQTPRGLYAGAGQQHVPGESPGARDGGAASPRGQASPQHHLTLKGSRCCLCSLGPTLHLPPWGLTGAQGAPRVP